MVKCVAIWSKVGLSFLSFSCTLSFCVRSWVSAGLPVDSLKLSNAQDYLFSLADRFVSLTVEEGGKINGVMCSVKSSRATRVSNSQLVIHYFHSFYQTKEKLQQALAMVADLLPYVQGSVKSDKTWDIDQLLTRSTDVAVSFVNIFLREFDGYVQHNQRQVIYCSVTQCVPELNNALVVILGGL